MRIIRPAALSALVCAPLMLSVSQSEAGYCPLPPQREHQRVVPSCVRQPPPVVRQRVEVPRGRVYYQSEPSQESIKRVRHTRTVVRERQTYPCGYNPCAQPRPVAVNPCNPCGGAVVASSAERVRVLPGNAVELEGITCRMSDGRIGLKVAGGCLAQR